MQILFDILRGHYYQRSDNKMSEQVARGWQAQVKKQPKLLWIGCADIYIEPQQATGMQREEIITHHNIANQIKNEDASVQSIIQYAIEHLRVTSIAVCGHYNCTSIQSALQTIENEEFTETPMSLWIQNLRELAFKHWSLLRTIPALKDRANLLAELNLISQMEKVKQNQFVKAAPHPIHIKGFLFHPITGIFMDVASPQTIVSNFY